MLYIPFQKKFIYIFLAYRDYVLWYYSKDSGTPGYNGDPWVDFAFGGEEAAQGAYEGCSDILIILVNAVFDVNILNTQGMYFLKQDEVYFL